MLTEEKWPFGFPKFLKMLYISWESILKVRDKNSIFAIITPEGTDFKKESGSHSWYSVLLRNGFLTLELSSEN